MRILVIEDDKKIASFISKGLKEAGYAVDTVHDGVDGLYFAMENIYDAAIIDIMLPGIDGLSIIERLRGKKIQTPVVILSAKRSVDDRVKGLQSGGDYYLTKPFSFSELLACIQALIRRDTKISEPTTLNIGDLSMDLLSREVTRNNISMSLPVKEFALLEYLMRNSGRIISKTSILEHVYDYSFDPQTNVVDVLICRVRNKIDKNFNKKLLHTVRGMGYVIKDE